MRTRNADNPKSTTLVKKTPPARKSLSKTLPSATAQPPSDATVTPKRRGKAVATTTTPETPDIKVEESDDIVKVTTPGTKSGNKRTVKKVVKRTVIRKKQKATPPASVKVEEEEEDDDDNIEEEKEKLDDEVKDVGGHEDVGVLIKDENDDVVDVEDVIKDVEGANVDVQQAVEQLVENVAASLGKESEEVVKTDEKEDVEKVEECLKIEEPSLEKEGVDEKESKEIDKDELFEVEEPELEVGKEELEVGEAVEDREIVVEKEKSVEIEQVPTEIEKVEVANEEPVDMEKDIDEEFKGDEDPQERVCLSDEEKDKDDEDEFVDDKGLDEEHAEIAAAAEDRRRRKEFEIFVGGLDRDATEEDVKKVFQNAGEVVEVRMHKELPTNKNKGYAFVRFANKEQVARALAEMKNPVIRGKRCGTAPSEDNDTLFLGNICNTWTKEAIRHKLKEYGIEGLERITLVADTQHEGLSRGFAFLEFSGHPDAMLAYKRLQKPDAIFGHPDRTAKVAFAEPLREPDPEVLAQVKSVFVDGLPPHWDEDILREHLKSYGHIERVMLARNMSTAKRKDFGFIDFTTHEAALACIDGINNRELGDEKLKVRARLSNPLPKTQAVKGGIAGGFRIGRGSGPTFLRAGRGFGRGALPANRMNFPRGRGFYQHGPGQTSRMGFAEGYLPAGPHSPFRGRQNFGGRWDNFRGPHQPFGQGTVPPRSDVDRPRHGVNMNRDHMPMRGQPFYLEEQFSRPYSGRRYEDSYTYGDPSRGVKRPYYADQDPGYSESSRARPRLDYSDPAISASGNRYRGSGSGSGPSRDYYNYDYSSYYADEQPYGGEGPYGGDRPYGGERQYGGERLYGGERPYGSDRPYGVDHPYGVDRPYGRGRSYGGRYHY